MVVAVQPEPCYHFRLFFLPRLESLGMSFPGFHQPENRQSNVGCVTATCCAQFLLCASVWLRFCLCYRLSVRNNDSRVGSSKVSLPLLLMLINLVSLIFLMPNTLSVRYLLWVSFCFALASSLALSLCFCVCLPSCLVTCNQFALADSRS